MLDDVSSRGWLTQSVSGSPSLSKPLPPALVRKMEKVKELLDKEKRQVHMQAGRR